MTNPKDPQAELRTALIDAIDNRRFDKEFPVLIYKDIEWLVDNCLLPLFQAHQQQLLSELLGELPEKLEIDPIGHIDYRHSMGFNEAIDQVVSILERLINAGKLDNSNPPAQKLDKSERKIGELNG